ncbi:MAG: hypothetical protein WAL80_20840 [Xanthobacteraceae bacterium]
MATQKRFAVVLLSGLALACAAGLMPVAAPAWAEELAHPAVPAETEHTCLNQKERRAEAESGKLVKLGVAMHAARARMPGTVVRARLCHGDFAGKDGGLVYVLTVLAHDGKVAQIAVDAVKGTLVGGL